MRLGVISSEWYCETRDERRKRETAGNSHRQVIGAAAAQHAFCKQKWRQSAIKPHAESQWELIMAIYSSRPCVHDKQTCSMRKITFAPMLKSSESVCALLNEKGNQYWEVGSVSNNKRHRVFYCFTFSKTDISLMSAKWMMEHGAKNIISFISVNFAFTFSHRSKFVINCIF